VVEVPEAGTAGVAEGEDGVGDGVEGEFVGVGGGGG